MLTGLPVLAANTGGPLETIVEGETGWLRSPDNPEAWTEVINIVLHKTTPKELAKIKSAGINRVKREFSQDKMAERLDEIVTSMGSVERKNLRSLLAVVGMVTAVLLDIVYFFYLKRYEGTDVAAYRKRKELPPFALSILAVVSAIASMVVGYAGTEDWVGGKKVVEVKQAGKEKKIK